MQSSNLRLKLAVAAALAGTMAAPTAVQAQATRQVGRPIPRAFYLGRDLLASGLGVVPRLAASLAKATFSPDLMMTDSECLLVSEPVPPGRMASTIV